MVVIKIKHYNKSNIEKLTNPEKNFLTKALKEITRVALGIERGRESHVPTTL